MVVVMGYGCHLSQKMKEYLYHAKSIAEQYDRSIVQVCGGATNIKTAKGVTEARMMANYLFTITDIPVILNECGTTTDGNLLHVEPTCVENDYEIKSLYIVCDDKRYYKVKYLAKRVMNHKYIISKFKFDNNIIGYLIQYFIATPVDIMAFKFPLINKLKQIYRNIIMKNS